MDLFVCCNMRKTTESIPAPVATNSVSLPPLPFPRSSVALFPQSSVTGHIGFSGGFLGAGGGCRYSGAALWNGRHGMYSRRPAAGELGHDNLGPHWRVPACPLVRSFKTWSCACLLLLTAWMAVDVQEVKRGFPNAQPATRSRLAGVGIVFHGVPGEGLVVQASPPPDCSPIRPFPGTNPAGNNHRTAARNPARGSEETWSRGADGRGSGGA